MENRENRKNFDAAIRQSLITDSNYTTSFITKVNGFPKVPID